MAEGRKGCAWLAFLVGAALGASPAEAQDREEGALFLLLPVGAEAVGVARTMTASSSPESAFWNPAGLAHLGGGRVLVLRGDHAAGTATGVSGVAALGARVAGGVSYSLLDSGTQDLTDGLGAVVGSIAVRQQQAIVSAALAPSARLSLGMNVKWIEFRQSCRGQCPDGGVRAMTWAGDIGVRARPLRERPLVLGLLVAHLGPDLRVRDVDSSEPLPTRLRVGATWTVVRELAEEELSFRFLLELEDRARSLGDPALLVGSEVSFGSTDQVAVRGGYVFGSHTQTDGAAVGLGLRYERIEVGVSRALARGGPALDQEPVHFTLGFVF